MMPKSGKMSKQTKADDAIVDNRMEVEDDKKPALTRPTADWSTVTAVAPNPRPAPCPPVRAPRPPSRRPQVPGAVAVNGPNPSSGDDDYTITNQSHSRSTTNQLASSSPNPVEPVTVEARLVDRNEEDMEELLQQQNEELERLHREQENAPVAVEVLPLDDQENLPEPADRRKLLLGGCIAVVVVVGVIIGIVVAVTGGSSTGPTEPAGIGGGSSPTSEPTPLPTPSPTVSPTQKPPTIPPTAPTFPPTPFPTPQPTIPPTTTTPGCDNANSLSCRLSQASYDRASLDLSFNGLTGTIPTEIGLFTNLRELWLNVNALTGSIPSEIGLLAKLTLLYLYFNELTGTIPTEIAMLTNLNELVLWGNALTGTIPSEIALMTNLNSLNLEINAFSGNFMCPHFINYCYISCDDYVFGVDQELNSTCRIL